jgi:hypothetical protein
MKKLKLEAIEVTSFETSDEVAVQAGTVRANQQPAASYPFQCPTDPAFDCTYGCSQFTGCPNGCGLLSQETVCA